MQQKRSFFERLTGSVNLNEDDYENEEEHNSKEENLNQNTLNNFKDFQAKTAVFKKNKLAEEGNEEGQLTIDCYKTPQEIIIESIVAGVKPDDLDVTITRDLVTIRGKRARASNISSENYLYQELYWGSFSRSIVLDEEIDVDAAEAVLNKNGIITITLPKLDKNRSQKIKVKND